MELGKSVDDQFSKLHPCLPVNTRIGIIGAGPSGISAAYALNKLGYNNVTLLEKYHTVGGMCESVEIEGKVYDLGGQVLAGNSAPAIFHLAKEVGCELEPMDSHKLALIDSSTGKYEDLKVVDDYVSMISLTLEIQDKAKNSDRIGLNAVSEITAELAPAYIAGHGVKSVPKAVAYGYTASGYGFVQDMPYAYIHEFTRTSMAGKIHRFKGGYMSFWQKIVGSLQTKLHCNTEVTAVRRNPSGVAVDIRDHKGGNEVLNFDKIIISGAFPFNIGKTYRSTALNPPDSQNEVIDMIGLEKQLFGKVITIDYYTTVLKIKGLEDMPVGFYYFNEYMDDPATIGNPVAMQRFFAETNIFLFWSYGNSMDIQGERVTELAIQAVKSMGAEVEGVVLQRRFKYFPHVSSEDMKDGFYKRLESELQGANNTYYVGGLMAFELTERNSSYAMALICKHFATDDSVPVFPYVKSLFPMDLVHGDRVPAELCEQKGVEFPDVSTLDGYLKYWGTHPSIQNKTLYTWINEGGVAASKRTYAELHTNASCIAREILKSRRPVINPGDRVLLVYMPGLDFIDAFFGCLRAMVLPVPVLPPDPLQRGGQGLLKIENVAKSSQAVAILSTYSYRQAVRAGFVKNLLAFPGKNVRSSGRWPDLPWLHTDSWVRNFNSTHPGDASDTPEPHPDDTCFLQFTSGSTGDAKGVMITHGGLIHNVKLMRKIYKSTSKTVLVSWLPQYHDMGLIGGLFTAMVSGGSAVLFSPLTFIKKPLLWLQIMSKYRSTHSAGPNFAFELVARRLELDKDRTNYDLSSIIFLMVAAEPVRQKTLKRFVELTRPFGLSQKVMAPGYGLAENCVFVCCAYGEGKPILADWQGRVCCGYVDPGNEDVDIKIVDPETGEEVKEAGKEGEIWISSPSAGVGYWGRDELTDQTFKNQLQNYKGRMYTRTGDLGRIIDGNLFITGRIKDLIIVAGRNIYSADVEKTVENSSELIRPGCCAVVGVAEEVLSAKGVSIPDGSDQVGLVVIAEVRDGKPVDKQIIEQIQERVAEEHGVSVAAIKFIKPKTISKTTSGKIKRFECLKQFTEETLSLVPEPLSKKVLLRSFTTGTCKEGHTPRPNLVSSPLSLSRKSTKDIVEFLKGLVSELTGIPTKDISATESLVSYGIDSIGVVRAAQKLSDFLGAPVGAVDIFTASCILDLATFSEDIVSKSQPQDSTHFQSEPDLYRKDFTAEVSVSRQLGIKCLQLLGLIYICLMLSMPAYLSMSTFVKVFTERSSVIDGSHWVDYIICLSCAPIAWMLCGILTSISIAIFGISFLRPNYVLSHEISVWSIDFVRWWTLYKVQQVASRVFAEHLRGTIFLKYWFEMLGANIGESVLIDSIDITDPSLVAIGDGTVIAEGAWIQSHEVKNGVLSFQPIRIGKDASIGPYSMLLKGSVLGDEAQVSPLQKVEGGKPVLRTSKPNRAKKVKEALGSTTNIQNQLVGSFIGVYMVSFLSTFSAAILYILYIWILETPALSQASFEAFVFTSIAGAYHWIPFNIIAYVKIFGHLRQNPTKLAISMAIGYSAHGIILTILTSSLAHLLSNNQDKKQTVVKNWIQQRIIVACHLRFAKLLSGTEAFCIYLRLLGAKVGRHCSLRAINAVSNPELLKIGDGVHLGDFSRIIPGFYSSAGFIKNRIEVQDNSVVGSQSVILPGSLIENDVILGALSLAPQDSVLQRGGIYVGSQTPVMIKNTKHVLDDRIEEMDTKYKKIVGNLAASLASTTLKVKSRYFHRIGVGGKGYLKIYDKIEGFPDHKIFHPGKNYPVVVRHSNSLSADDDARIDARGAAVRILSDESDNNVALIDLTLKTGKAFYARTIADFATWLVCGLPAREAHVNKVPHIRDAVWTSLRNASSYTELHYYSNICRLFRFSDGQEMYVKFKLRPYDETISEDSGKVEPTGILPPETGAIPRDQSDTRPMLFLADDFQSRVNCDGVHYIFQIQLRPATEVTPVDEMLDCTRPWDEAKFPYISIGEIFIDQNLTNEEVEELVFNPFLKCHEVDIIRASSSTQSASIDHGRSLVYQICQHLRNKEPLPEAWKLLLEQSDVKVDLSGSPIAVATERPEIKKVTLERTLYQTCWAIFVQPSLQTVLPFFLMGLAIFAPLNIVLDLNDSERISLHWLLPVFWVSSGILAALLCVAAKWVLVGKKKEGETINIWSPRVFMDTIWQALRTLICDYFMEMAGGSSPFLLWMKLMGSKVELEQGTYVDSMGALLNPEMVEIESGCSVEREALLFGHIYEGEGKVKFGKIRIGEGGSVGTRAVAMPGVTIQSGGTLAALSLAMKEEIVK